MVIKSGRLLPDRGLPGGQGEDGGLASALGEAEDAGQADDGGARQVIHLFFLFCGRGTDVFFFFRLTLFSFDDQPSDIDDGDGGDLELDLQTTSNQVDAIVIIRPFFKSLFKRNDAKHLLFCKREQTGRLK